MNEPILITGATGHVGGALTRLLLQAGHSVRTINRDTSKTAELTALGADARVGSLHDGSFVTDSFQGVGAAFLMLPPNYQSADLRAEQRSIIDQYVAAIQQTGVQYAISLSSMGAHLAEGAGIIQPLHDLEQALNSLSELNVRHLRPGYFMENLYAQVGLIQAQGTMAAPIRADLKMGVVAAQDIAVVAARLLMHLDFRGQSVQFVLGQRDLTYAEMAQAIGQAIGRPGLSYQTVSSAEAYLASVAMGISPHVAVLLNEYVEQVNAGRVSEGAVRNAFSTTPTSIETFARQFAQAITI